MFLIRRQGRYVVCQLPRQRNDDEAGRGDRRGSFFFSFWLLVCLTQNTSHTNITTSMGDAVDLFVLRPFRN